ncbi:AlbA family DNA-binding domain-containing protein [Anaeromicrobium sediminis]|uniref:Schlafen AlbA-2 domain-containing protein n=1 Tax=Anaeromicrobium sediminis TaxID=1478221 RepID=A0A267MQX0_9FIRM|nr:RNA-binding domain-containing protein [Anaeromicrobium sediminis]PAB61308.1 hypothetical protein CCE28_02430 [Anaeromicrobium sediminis]
MVKVVTENDIDLVIANGENQYVEFKRGRVVANVIAKHISAFANSYGGQIIIGVDERVGVVGVDRNWIEKEFRKALSFLSPNPNAEINWIQYRNAEVAIIDVSKSPQPIACRNVLYKRKQAMIETMDSKSIITAFKQNQKSESQIIAEMAQNIAHLTTGYQICRNLMISQTQYNQRW